jgi:predicted MFS family arabinose efflux permease
VAAIAFGSFALVVAEVLPVGMLPHIAAGLGVQEGTAGLAVAVPAIVAAASALVISATAGRIDRRHLLLAVAAVFVASNVIAAIAPDFGMLIIARALLGVSIGGFWSQAGGFAARITHERFTGRATALIFGGIAVGTVVWVPVSEFLTTEMSWRGVFGSPQPWPSAPSPGRRCCCPGCWHRAEPRSARCRGCWAAGP